MAPPRDEWATSVWVSVARNQHFVRGQSISQNPFLRLKMWPLGRVGTLSACATALEMGDQLESRTGLAQSVLTVRRDRASLEAACALRLLPSAAFGHIPAPRSWQSD